MKKYFNTTNENADVEQMMIFRTSGQDSTILEVFKQFPNKRWSAWKLYDYFQSKFPITSVRRSLNTLWKTLKIVRVGKEYGVYGANEFTYQLSQNADN